jgi:hypothetical protein
VFVDLHRFLCYLKEQLSRFHAKSFEKEKN